MDEMYQPTTNPSRTWQFRGGTANDGRTYGPPDYAVPYGTKGCPLAPRNYRAELGDIELPPELLEGVFAARLKVADLDLEAWQALAATELSYEDRQKLMAFLYQLPVPESQIAIEGGISAHWLYSLPISPRTRNALRRHFSANHVEEIPLSPITFDKFLRIRGCGKTALIELLCVMESAELGYIAEDAQIEKRPKTMVVTESQFQSAVHEATYRALQGYGLMKSRIGEFAGWALSETDAKTLGEAVTISASSQRPPDSWLAIASIELSEIDEAPRHPYEIIEAWVADLPHRERLIFEKRVANSSRIHTLQELADSLNISRERVRQLEKRVLSKFAGFTRKKIASPIKWRVDTIRDLVGVATTVGQIAKVLRPNEGQMDYSRLLFRMAGPYEITGDWIVSTAAIDEDPTESVRDMADELGFIDLEVAHTRLSSWGLDWSNHLNWLTRNGTIREFSGRLASWGGSIGDKLVVVLADIGRPATIDTLLDCIQEDRSRTSAINALSVDHRVIKVNSIEWALASWGLPEYRGIAMSIRALLSGSAGAVHIDEITSRMHRDFGSAESSIRAYCYAPMFVVQNGWVRLREDFEAFTYSDCSPRTARGVFYLGQSRVAILTEVKEGLLRGSGRSIPMAVGAILEVPIDKAVTFANEGGGSITVSYPATSFLGPTLGSARSLAESLGANLGDHLTIILDRSKMSVSGTVTRTNEHSPSWQTVARLTGIEATSQMKGLAHALDCREDEVRVVLKSRGDGEVAQAIPDEGSASIGLDDALGRLQDQLEQR